MAQTTGNALLGCVVVVLVTFLCNGVLAYGALWALNHLGVTAIASSWGNAWLVALVVMCVRGLILGAKKSENNE